MRGDVVRKLLSLILILSLLVIPCGCVSKDSVSIGIIPLDSRPCNTQYAQLLGEMAGHQVVLPDGELLDDFTVPSEPLSLWNWLNEQDCDHYILFTNQLLNGGLIHSRSLKTYAQQDQFFTNLQSFIDTHSDRSITIISVLPRLLPSQYDTQLWQYQKALSSYGSALDKALQLGLPAPDMPADVPAAYVEQYLALYQTDYEFLLRLSEFAGENVSLVIGQDDAQEYCPSNVIYRALQELENENMTLLHGADELTMMTVARYQAVPSSLRIVYSDDAFADAYYPYEGVSLAEGIAEKLAYLRIRVDENAEDTLLVHTDRDSISQTLSLLRENNSGYLGLADIAYTNKGDVALSDALLTAEVFDKVYCYSGWNTASNTLGTVLAHYQVSKSFAGDQQAAEAALAFKLVRFSEDLVYQGFISNELRGELLNQKKMDGTTTFTDELAYTDALARLQEQFSPYAERLSLLAEREQVILPGVTVRCSQTDYTIVFPWNRAFEVYVQWDTKVKPI